MTRYQERENEHITEMVNGAAKRFCFEHHIEYTEDEDVDNDVEFAIECANLKGGQKTSWSLKRYHATEKALKQFPGMYRQQEQVKLAEALTPYVAQCSKCERVYSMSTVHECIA